MERSSCPAVWPEVLMRPASGIRDEAARVDLILAGDLRLVVNFDANSIVRPQRIARRPRARLCLSQFPAWPAAAGNTIRDTASKR